MKLLYGIPKPENYLTIYYLYYKKKLEIAELTNELITNSIKTFICNINYFYLLCS